MSEKETYLKELKKQVDDWDKKLNKLNSEAVVAKAETKADIKKGISDLERKRNELRERIKELEAASDKTFADVKAAVQKNWSDLDGALTNFAQSLLDWKPDEGEK